MIDFIILFTMNITLILFLIGILGFVLNRKNVILMLICIEICINRENIVLMLILSWYRDEVFGLLFVYVISNFALLTGHNFGSSNYSFRPIGKLPSLSLCGVPSSFIHITFEQRYYSTLIPQNQRLDPWWVTGFVDGEGTFSVSVVESSTTKTGWAVQPKFSIILHNKDKSVLEKIKLFLGVGRISTLGLQDIQFEVRSLKELEIIIKHFEIFFLHTKKKADFEQLKEVYQPTAW
jgi:NADH:ubiquinone oxidoreductase subunit K